MNKREIEERKKYIQDFRKKIEGVKGDPEEKYKILDLLSEYEMAEAPKEVVSLTFTAGGTETLCEDGEVYHIKSSVGIGEYCKPMPYKDFTEIFPSQNTGMNYWWN